MTADLLHVLAKAALGGVLVVVFAVLAETLHPKRLAGVFAAAPSVALASLLVTVLSKGPADARDSCLGMAAGAVGFVAYCLLAPASIRRWGALRGSGAALFGWLLVTAAALPLSTAALAPTTAAAGGGGTGERASRRRPRLRCEPGEVREVSPRDWVVRFAFGAATSAVAGVVSVLAGPFLAGTFLAFPAILLASLTLVAKEDGEARARDDARGATAGALGLVAFAALGAATFTRTATPAAFASAAAAWVVVALGAYAVAWSTGAGADEPRDGVRG